MRESEERYRHLVHMLPDGLIVVLEGNIVFANHAMLTMLGISNFDDIIGDPINKFIHPEYLERFPAMINYLIIEANPSTFTYFELLRMDQQAIEVEMRAVAVKFDGKNAVQLIIHDITKQKRMEASLHEKDYLYKSLMENVVAGVFVGQCNKIVYANPYLAEMYGYTLEEMYELNSSDLVSMDEINRHKNEIMHGSAIGLNQFPLKCKGRKKTAASFIWKATAPSLCSMDSCPCSARSKM